MSATAARHVSLVLKAAAQGSAVGVMGLSPRLFRGRLTMRRRINPKRTSKAIEEAAERDAEREFHNLRLGKMLAQRAEQALRHAMAIFPGGH